MDPEHYLQQSPFIAILRGIEPEEVISYADAIVAAGWRCIEVPLNSPDPLESISRLCSHFGEKVLIGAGTVTTVKDVAAVVDAGGRLIVAPNMERSVILSAISAGAVVMPGFLTPTEAFGAYETGARYLKLFPADTMGPAYVRAIRSVMPADAKIIPVGGVSPANALEFKNAGACAFGIGTQVYKRGMTVAETSIQARKFTAAIES